MNLKIEEMANNQIYLEKRYEDMEYAWISSATRLYPNFVNVELEKSRFKEWFDSELAQNYIHQK
jgi:hypothetical protein